MKIIVIGATGTIGANVAEALSVKKHEVIRASRNSDIKVNLDDPATIRALFERVHDVDALVSCAGNAAFKPFSQLTDADYQLGLRSKLMGQVSAARIASEYLRDGGSITLTTGVLAMHPIRGSASVSLVNAGLEGFVRAAALEMPRRLRINAVSSTVGEGDIGEVGYGSGTRSFCRRRGEGICGRSRRFPARSDIRPAPVCLDTGAFSTDPPPTRLTGRQKRRKDVVSFQHHGL